MENTNPVHWIGHIPANELANAKSRVEKFNQRAARAGIEARYTVAYSEWVREEPAKLVGLPPVVTPYLTFVVLGQALKVADWTFAATLTFDAEAGVITRPVPDGPAIDLSELRTLTSPKCDECGTSRYRKDIYVLVNDTTGELKVVGRNCLAAFLGLDPAGSLNYIGWEPESTLGELGGWAGEYRIPVTALLAVTSAAVAQYGWVAKSGVGTPTAFLVTRYFFPAHSGKQAEADRQLIAEINDRLNADGGAGPAVARAEAVLEWARTTDDLRGEYGSNLRAVLTAETISTRNVGIACSAISTWSKSVEREIERTERSRRTADSSFVGQPGDKLVDLKLEVVAPPRFIQGDYGVTTLLTFADEAGNVFKWFASGTHDYTTVGEKVVLKGTVKKHEEYNGAKSTVLTRCKIA